jgi:hypothetical protein
VNRKLAALAAIPLAGGLLTAVACSTGPPTAAQPSASVSVPTNTAATTAAGMPAFVASLNARNVRWATPGVVLRGTWNGHPFIAVKTSATDLGKYGVSASEQVGAWQAGLVDNGNPDPQLNQQFGQALGY